MSLSIMTNVSSLSAQRSLAETSKVMETAMERLSSGKRVNSAADDASGLATIQRMDAQINGLNQAVRNANDGQAMVQSIEAALSEVGDILQRLRTLAVQSASDTSSGSDRTYMNDEKTALLAEINRIGNQSQFNGVNILDGTLAAELQVGAKANDTIALSQASVKTDTLGGFVNEQGAVNAQALHSSAVDARLDGGDETIGILGHLGTATTAVSTDNDGAKEQAAAINAIASQTGVRATARTAILVTALTSSTALNLTLKAGDSGTSVSTGALASATLTSLGNAINAVSATSGISATLRADGLLIEDVDGDDIILTRTDTTGSKDMTIKTLAADLTTTVASVDLAALNSTDTHEGRFGGMLSLTSEKTYSVTTNGTDATRHYIASATVTATTINGLDLTTKAKSNTAIALLDGAIETIASHRAGLGAVDNRLEHTVSNLMSLSEATSDAKGRIQDADFAVESANLAKAQVLMQAGTAMLAQANSSPQMVLQLLQ